MKYKFDTHVLIAILSFICWGLFPLYFKLLAYINPFEVILHRIMWSFFLMLVVILIRKYWQHVLQILANKFTVLKLLCSSLLISSNWLIFVYGVSNDKVLETSLGYFTSPLITIFLGIIFLKERVGNIKKCAIILTIMALIFKILVAQNFSFITIGTALTFSFYSLIKRTIKANSVVLFFVETLLLVIPSAIAWSLMVARNDSIVSSDLFSASTALLLLGLGILTSIPLLLFNYSIRHINLSIMGFIQYITPSMTFLIGSLLYKEALNILDFVVFVLIWTAILLVSTENYHTLKKS